MTDQQRAAAQAQAGPFFTTVGTMAAFAFGGEIIEGAVGAWDLLVGGAESAEETAAASSAYVNTSARGALVTNITTDVSVDEATATLEQNGFHLTSSSGPSSTYTNAAGDSYTIRPSNTAPGGQAMDFGPAGRSSVTVKINLGK